MKKTEDAEERGRLDSHGRSLPGSERTKNEDHFVIAQMRKAARIQETNLGLDEDSRVFGPTQGYLFAVADGLGLDGYGERASGILVRDIVHTFLQDIPWSDEESPAPIVRASLERLQEQLLSLASDEVPSPRPGSTLTLAHVRWPELLLVHLGDSRAYLQRNGVLRQLTRDHTMAEAVRLAGGEPAQDSRDTETTLWNAVGGNSEPPRPQIESVQLELGDQLLLCSDGVWRELDEQVIGDRLTLATDAEDATRRLVEDEREDDRTAIVARFLPADEVASPVSEAPPDRAAAIEKSPPNPSPKGAA